jgi:hypothetical protein
MLGVGEGIAADWYVNFDRNSFICDDIAAPKTVVSGSGLPWDEAGVRVPAVS